MKMNKLKTYILIQFEKVHDITIEFVVINKLHQTNIWKKIIIWKFIGSLMY